MTKMLLPLCALLLLPVTALAAPEPTTTVDNDEGATVSQEGETRRLIFGEGDEVDGDRLAPSGENLYGAVRMRHESMIEIREDFLDQLFKLSADF